MVRKKAERKKLAHKLVDVNSIKPNEWNYNEQNDFIRQKERQSIEQFGFIDPILVRTVGKGYEIIDGEHRWIAAKELSLDVVPVIDLGVVPDEVAKKMTIAMNEIHGSPDFSKLATVVSDLFEIDENLISVLPFSDVRLKELLSVRNLDIDKLLPPPPTKEKEGTAKDKFSMKFHFLAEEWDFLKEFLDGLNMETQEEAVVVACKNYLRR